MRATTAHVFCALCLGVACGIEPLARERSFCSIRAEDDPAGKLLSRARTALGGSARLREIYAIAVRGSFSSDASNGELRLFIQGPTSVRKETAFGALPALAFVMASDGASYWDGKSRGGIDSPAPVEGRFRERFRLQLLQEASRFLTVWFMSTPTVTEARARSSGVWVWQTGRGDSVEVSAPDGFAIGRLAFDAATGLPCRLGFRSGVPFTLGTKPSADRVPAEWELLDYQRVDGVSVPHRIVMFLNGNLDRDLRLQTVQINHPLPAEAFHPGPRQ